MNKIIWSIGHSTRSEEEFANLLRENKIQLLADVRKLPGSNKFPHFNQEHISTFLKSNGIAYLHFLSLGGRRSKDKSNYYKTAWRNAAFDAYANYMNSEEFQEAAKILTDMASKENTAIMCSEAVWWKCHRSLIADYLKANEWKVLHILGKGKAQEHPYTSPSKIINGALSYAPD